MNGFFWLWYSAPKMLHCIRATINSITVGWGIADGCGADIREYTLEMNDFSKGYGRCSSPFLIFHMIVMTLCIMYDVPRLI